MVLSCWSRIRRDFLFCKQHFSAFVLCSFKKDKLPLVLIYSHIFVSIPCFFYFLYVHVLCVQLAFPKWEKCTFTYLWIFFGCYIKMLCLKYIHSHWYSMSTSITQRNILAFSLKINIVECNMVARVFYTRVVIIKWFIKNLIIFVLFNWFYI